MGFTGKSACKQTVPSSLLRQVHSLFAEGLPISDNTRLYAQSAPFLFKHCPNPVAALEFFPSVSYTFTSTEPAGCRQILGHLQPVSQIQDFSQLLQQVILSTSRFLLANFILASAGFKNISVPIKNRSFTPKKNHCYGPSSLAAGNSKEGRHSIPTVEKCHFRDLFQFPLNIDVLAQSYADR